jgi:peptide deformylase
VQIKEKNNTSLTLPAREVNVRMLKENRYYRDLIGKVCDYMLFILKHRYSDYTPLKGLSGANVAVPFNIIAIATESDPLVMINPVIAKVSRKTRTVSSNCGSINLPKAVQVKRREWVEVSYYDIEGEHCQKRFDFASGSAVIQHEVDHNRGVLITDYDKHL